MRKCPVCQAGVRGRSDKIYCSAQCKSNNQYEQKLESETLYLKIDRQLKTNRKILKRHNRSGYTTLRKEELLEEGFDPNYFTHYWKSSKGKIYLFCYEYGFLAIEQKESGKYLIVKWQDYMNQKEMVQ